jgi:hypothetical protein
MSTAPVNPSVEQAAEWIHNYLREHPRASDTAEGIQRWWLAPNFGEVALATVEMALKELLQDGVVVNTDPLALRRTYGRNPARDRPS